MISWAKRTYLSLSAAHPKWAKAFRFLVSGGTAAVTNLGLLYVFTAFLGFWYIFSAIASFIIAFWVSFGMQKYWTFQDMSKDGVHRQMAVYLIVAVVNLCINTGILYLFVEYAHIYYILSQALASVIVAFESYFVYQIFIFKRNVPASDQSEPLT